MTPKTAILYYFDGSTSRHNAEGLYVEDILRCLFTGINCIAIEIYYS